MNALPSAQPTALQHKGIVNNNKNSHKQSKGITYLFSIQMKLKAHSHFSVVSSATISRK